MNERSGTQMTLNFGNSTSMPVLFLGHGSPMNVIEENEFTEGWKRLALTLPKPKGILCISAHWETKGCFVTSAEAPPTIHDFGGFPEELYNIRYAAQGSPRLANEVIDLVKTVNVNADMKRGFDHGCWSVISRMYPEANIPMVQLSLDHLLNPEQHFELAKELAPLREKGILIVGSGNMVHNLRMVAWDKMNADDYGFDWAIEASTKMKTFINKGDDTSLIRYAKQGKEFELAIPTPEHFLPLLYVIAIRDKNDTVRFFNDKAVGGSLTMTCVAVENSL